MKLCRAERAWIMRSVDGDLLPGEALRLARHLATCTACRIELAREERLAGMLAEDAGGVGVDESFFRAVMDSLPDLPPKPAAAVSRKARWRRGLRLAGFTSITVVAAGFAARTLPSLRLDVEAPAWPRFTPDDTGSFLSLLGTAAQWIRMTVESITWAGSPEGFRAWTMGALSWCAVIAAGAALLAVSGLLARAASSRSRAS